MNNNNLFTLKIGGSAGQGIKSAGLMFAKAATRSGYHIYDYIEYPSLIRGGHNAMQITVSQEEVTAPCTKVDLLIALNQDTVNRYIQDLPKGSGLIYDDEDVSKAATGAILYQVPLSKLAQETGGKDLLTNTVALGVVMALWDGNIEILKKLIGEEFGDKNSDIVDMNNKAAEAGYNYIKEHYPEKIQNILTPLNSISPKMVLNGNDAIAMGAIAAGLQFAAIYPMSPISNILHILAAHQEKYGYVYKQPEDEISAINMTIGAAFAGARSMTATSGGGFCLMSEGYGLAGMTETPLVIINGMRPGPATGLPTWSEQGDLRFVLHAHQGDFPKIVLAAGDAKEAFELTLQAFNLAEKYQTPVVLLTDKNICEDDQSFAVFDISSYEVRRGKLTKELQPEYKRYLLETDGVSTRTIPGTGTHFIANSDEHNESGYDSEEISDRKTQMEKRMKKLETCAKEDMPAPVLIGPENADVTLVSWGSNKGSIIQAMKQYDNVNYLHITWMSPFPKDAVKQILMKSKYIINVECNYTAQLGGLIREKTGIDILDNLLKYDGRPFFVEEIVDKINSVMHK